MGGFEISAPIYFARAMMMYRIEWNSSRGIKLDLVLLDLLGFS